MVKNTSEAIIIQKVNNKLYELVKRAFDVLCSLFAVIVLAIPMLILCIVIFIDDPHGSPIFVQTRVGKNGKFFKFYKLRSMYVDAERKLDTLLEQNEMEGPAFKIKNDPRITRIGKFIRKSSLDELPQFINVLKGDMSIVGPRPPLPREVEQYTDYQKQRLSVIPGLTCYWQVQERRNDLSFDEWLALDLKYISERNILLDIKLMIKTVETMVSMHGE